MKNFDSKLGKIGKGCHSVDILLLNACQCWFVDLEKIIFL